MRSSGSKAASDGVSIFMAMVATSTIHLCIRDVDFCFSHAFLSDRLHEQSAAAEVELVFDGKASRIIREDDVLWARRGRQTICQLWIRSPLS